MSGKKSNNGDNVVNSNNKGLLKISNDSGKKKNVNERKNKRKRKLPKSSRITTAKLPEKPEDISSNWKKLLVSLPKTNKTKRSISHKGSKPNSEILEKKRKPEIWFDDVDPLLLDPEDRPSDYDENEDIDKDVVDDEKLEPSLVKSKSYKGLTKIVGMDCEMVGVGFDGASSILARVSIVNHFGNAVYDKYVKPTEKVTDYRTKVSGIRPENIINGQDFKTVQAEVAEILKGRILVGHSIKHDLKVLFLDHPKKRIRDTSTYKPFRESFGGRTPSLKNLSAKMLGVKVQDGEHSSVQDAQAAVRLYTMYRKEWERSIDEKKKSNPNNKHKKKKYDNQTKPVKDIKPQYQDSSDSE